jgi:hypothetical protein
MKLITKAQFKRLFHDLQFLAQLSEDLKNNVTKEDLYKSYEKKICDYFGVINLMHLNSYQASKMIKATIKSLLIIKPNLKNDINY